MNSAVWSGGSFIYVPPNVKVDLPLQAYFRINAENIGQFERTLIIADEGSEVHYIEGYAAPVYTTESLHSAVVELIAKKGAKIRYTTIQNWSKDVYNLVTKRAYAYENASVEWIDGNLGSRLTMKYPGVYMLGRNAHAEVISVAFSGSGQHQDAGAKAFIWHQIQLQGLQANQLVRIQVERHIEDYYMLQKGLQVLNRTLGVMHYY